MDARPTFAALALAVSLAAAGAACGPSNPQPETPPTPTADATPPTPPPTAAPTTTAATPPPPTPPPPSGPAGTPLQASKLLADMKKAGLDPAKYPVFEKMPIADKKRVMPFFVKALGYKDCSGCHASLSDYKTQTHNMQLARGMWNHFIAYARDTSDGVIFCDSCHVGNAKILNRADREGVKKFMETEYVGKLHRADKKATECSTCHGDAMELDIFGKLWGVK